MSEFKVEKPGFYWRRDGQWVFVLAGETNCAIVHQSGGVHFVGLSGRFEPYEGEHKYDLVEYIGPTMPETLTRPEPEKKLRPWTSEEVPVGAVIKMNTGRFYWKWPHEDNDAWRPCGVLE